MSVIVEVRLWGTTVGHLGYAPGQTEVATFEYTEYFMRSGIQLSPLVMAYPPARFTFDAISRQTFHGVPGIIADSLPDKFGNRLIDQYMADKGIPEAQVSALDRLLYIGNRGMGALEYEPAERNDADMQGAVLNLAHLSELAEMVLRDKETFARHLADSASRHEMLEIIRVGSSAGGARSKALVSRDAAGRFYDGTKNNGPGHTYWLLKFDSAANSDRERKDPKGMPRIEYIYARLARECGIDMPAVDYVVDGDDFHFLTERFDRVVNRGRVEKLHYASLAGLKHFDRESTGTYSYEQLVLACRQLGLGQNELKELFRRAVFNVVGRNHDDHAKNFGFLMNRRGEWRLSPAFDMTYAYDPTGKWTRTHQFVLNKKRDGFVRDDLLAFARKCDVSEKAAHAVIDRTVEAFSTFGTRARELEVPLRLRETIEQNLRYRTL